MENSKEYQLHYSILSECLTPQKKELLEEKVLHRSNHIFPIFDQPEKSHNLSAILRTSEAFGLQSVGVISFDSIDIDKAMSKSSEKWLNFFEWDHAEAMHRDLKNKGYRILITDLNQESKSIEEIDWTVPTAVCLGNERKGISEELRNLADGSLHIPMRGFTESLNVSVAWGILSSGLAKLNLPQLSELERYQTLLMWAIRTLPEGEAIYLNSCRERGLTPLPFKQKNERAYRKFR